MLSFHFPVFYRLFLFMLIFIFSIGTSNVYSFIAYVPANLNFESVASIHFVSVDIRDKDKVSIKEQPSKELKKTDSDSKLIEKSGSSPSNPYNQDIIIPLNALLNDNHFDKKQLQIPLGAIVNWKNNDTIDHNIQVFHRPSILFFIEPIGSKNLKPFETLSIKFDQPGKYIYQCSSPNHKFMKGSIFVK